MLSKKDIIEALNLDDVLETKDNFMWGMLAGIGIGALVGSAVALLLAPKAGTELRQTLSEKTSGLVDKARARVTSTMNREGIGQGNVGTNEPIV